MSGKAHIAVLLVTLLSVGFILRLVRARKLRAKYSILWLSIGVVLIGLSAWPDLLDRVSNWLGISYGPATFLLGAITLLFLIVIHFSFELSRLEERTRSLAEELALRSVDLSGTPEPGEHVGISDAAPSAQAAPVGQSGWQQTQKPGERPEPAGDDRRGGPPAS